ncbi:hypothetical protein BH10ACI3_BH10ACI3_01320 [soil metagenome]
MSVTALLRSVEMASDDKATAAISQFNGQGNDG